jgi:hypothetical protein
MHVYYLLAMLHNISALFHLHTVLPRINIRQKSPVILYGNGNSTNGENEVGEVQWETINIDTFSERVYIIEQYLAFFQ